MAASRATALAALLPDDPARREEFLALVRDISPWEVVSKSNRTHPLIQKARELIRERYVSARGRVIFEGDRFVGRVGAGEFLRRGRYSLQ